MVRREHHMVIFRFRAYPWTRLGYTYDWNEAGDEYGLTEFIILPGSEVEIEWTLTTDEFIAWLSEGGLNG